jgi:hypothetical protein
VDAARHRSGVTAWMTAAKSIVSTVWHLRKGPMRGREQDQATPMVVR